MEDDPDLNPATISSETRVVIEPGKQSKRPVSAPMLLLIVVGVVLLVSSIIYFAAY